MRAGRQAPTRRPPSRNTWHISSHEPTPTIRTCQLWSWQPDSAELLDPLLQESQVRIGLRPGQKSVSELPKVVWPVVRVAQPSRCHADVGDLGGVGVLPIRVLLEVCRLAPFEVHAAQDVAAALDLDGDLVVPADDKRD